MKSYHIILEGRSYLVEVLSDPAAAQVQVRVDGENLMVAVQDPTPADQAQPVPAPAAASRPAPVVSPQAATSSLTGDHTLRAPLPGTVVGVSVTAGQTVSGGDELLVIEAMKMNNRIRSPRNGTVAEVFVGVGDQVGHGAPLLAWQE